MISKKQMRTVLERVGYPVPKDVDDLYHSVADLLDDDVSQLSSGEREMLVNMLWQLTNEVELAVRIRLADRLSESENSHRELLFVLANDDIRVAYNVLTKSPMLNDDALIRVIRNRTKSHRLAVTMRKGLSSEVCDALAACKETDVIVALLNNQSAQISESVLEFLVEDSKRVDMYQLPLVRRQDLPTALAERMCEWVAGELLRQLVENHDLDRCYLDGELSGATNKVDLDSERAGSDLVLQLAKAGALDAEFLARSLRQGHISLFEMALSHLAGTDTEICRNLIYDFDDMGLSAICKAADIDLENYTAIRKSVLSIEGKKPSKNAEDGDRAVAMYETVNREQAKRLIDEAGKLSKPEFKAAYSRLIETNNKKN